MPSCTREAERAHAVHQAEVDRLRGATLVRVDLLLRHAEHFGRGRAVHVLAAVERGQQAGVAGQVRHDAQLDLRVVRGDDLPALRRDERLADAPAFLGADRDVLQVRIGRRQPPGRRDRLVVAGVHAAGARIDDLRQLLGVGRAQLRQAAVIEDQARQLVLVGDRLQRLLVGRGLAARRLHRHRQLQLVEQDRRELLGRVEAEGAPGDRVRLRGELVHALAQLLALRAQLVGVDQHAALLHAREHRHQRHFDLGVDRLGARLGCELRPQRVVQAQRDVGVFGGVAAGGVEVDLRERDLLGALAGHVLVVDRLVAEMALGQRVHVVARRGRVQHVGFEHRVVSDAAHVDAVVRQHVDVVLAVLAELGPRRVFEHRLQRGEHVRPR